MTRLLTLVLPLALCAVGCDDDDDTTSDSGASSEGSGGASGSTSTSATTGSPTTSTGASTSGATAGSTGGDGGSTGGDGSTGSLACTGSAAYRITLDSDWADPNVPNRHFSPLIGAVHPVGTALWHLGELATPGIEDMAETGATAILRGEVQTAIGNGQATAVIDGPGIGVSPGTASANTTVDADAPAITIVSMIAPSPDWFAGLDAIDLCDGGQWVAMLTLPAPIYDAGTDSGANFTSPNQNTSPAEPIAEHPTVGSIGMWIIERTDG